MIEGRDKFLTEAMGEKWYTRADENPNWPKQFQAKNSNFSTWNGFGKLWEWCQKQPWWIEFIAKSTQRNYLLDLVNPDKLADAVYTYLRNRANAISMEQVGEVKYK